jgi:hypothetical protein
MHRFSVLLRFFQKSGGVIEMDRQNFFEETWDHFVTQGNPPGVRVTDNGNTFCSYEKGCVVGRHMPKKWCRKADTVEMGVADLVDHDPRLGKALCKKFDIEDFGRNGREDIEFLEEMQNWHDIEFRTYKSRTNGSFLNLLKSYRKIAKKFHLDASFLEGVVDDKVV